MKDCYDIVQAWGMAYIIKEMQIDNAGPIVKLFDCEVLEELKNYKPKNTIMKKFKNKTFAVTGNRENLISFERLLLSLGYINGKDKIIAESNSAFRYITVDLHFGYRHDGTFVAAANDGAAESKKCLFKIDTPSIFADAYNYAAEKEQTYSEILTDDKVFLKGWDMVYMARPDRHDEPENLYRGYFLYQSRACNLLKIATLVEYRAVGWRFFSTFKARTNWIDSFTNNPKYTTEDGVVITNVYTDIFGLRPARKEEPLAAGYKTYQGWYLKHCSPFKECAVDVMSGWKWFSSPIARIEWIAKQRKPLLKTEDNVEKYLDDKVWTVTPQFRAYFIKDGLDEKSPWKGYKYFDKEQNAKEWVENHRPQYSRAYLDTINKELLDQTPNYAINASQRYIIHSFLCRLHDKLKKS